MSKNRNKGNRRTTHHTPATPRVIHRPFPRSAPTYIGARNASLVGFDDQPAFDQRTFNFENRPLLVGKPTHKPPRIVQTPQKRPYRADPRLQALLAQNKAPWASLATSAPANTLHCVRRKQRKQVLFAKRLTAKGARSPKRHTATSEIRC